MSLSAHPFNIGVKGPTGDEWINKYPPSGLSGYAATGPKGPTGKSGPYGSTGPSGETGHFAIGLTYSSTGPNAHHLIIQYQDGSTSGGGYYRGPTGSEIYHLFGENKGFATAGVFYQENRGPNGVLYLKSITGGNGVRIDDDGSRIRIRYKTFNAVTAHGRTGELVFSRMDSAGTTGLSGATFTNYYAGPTYALSVTTRTYNEVSARIAPYTWEEDSNTFVYKINPVDALSLKAAQANSYTRLSGNVFVVDPNKDYELWFGGPPTDKQRPFVKFIDSSAPTAVPHEFLEKFTPFSSAGFTLIIIDGETLGERTTSKGETVTYPYIVSGVFPSNWKFTYSLQPTLSSDIDTIQFITLGDEDNLTEKTEWYGMYVRTGKDINPFSW